jgi:hypothetical protein
MQLLLICLVAASAVYAQDCTQSCEAAQALRARVKQLQNQLQEIQMIAETGVLCVLCAGLSCPCDPVCVSLSCSPSVLRALVLYETVVGCSGFLVFGFSPLCVRAAMVLRC